MKKRITFFWVAMSFAQTTYSGNDIVRISSDNDLPLLYTTPNFGNLSPQAQRVAINASLSSLAYKNGGGSIPGFTVLDGVPASKNNVGFQAYAYKNNATGDITIAIRGTYDKPGLIADVGIAGSRINDLSNNSPLNPLAFGVQNFDAQVAAAHDFNAKIQADNPNANIQFTGHSLGGAVAQIEASRTGANAITFESAPVSDYIKSHIQNPNTNGIDNYYRGADVIPNNGMLDQAGTIHVLPNALNPIVTDMSPGKMFVDDAVAQHSIQGLEKELYNGLPIPPTDYPYPNSPMDPVSHPTSIDKFVNDVVAPSQLSSPEAQSPIPSYNVAQPPSYLDNELKKGTYDQQMANVNNRKETSEYDYSPQGTSTSVSAYSNSPMDPARSPHYRTDESGGGSSVLSPAVLSGNSGQSSPINASSNVDIHMNEASQGADTSLPNQNDNGSNVQADTFDNSLSVDYYAKKNNTEQQHNQQAIIAQQEAQAAALNNQQLSQMSQDTSGYDSGSGLGAVMDMIGGVAGTVATINSTQSQLPSAPTLSNNVTGSGGPWSYVTRPVLTPNSTLPPTPQSQWTNNNIVGSGDCPPHAQACQ